MTPRDDQIRSFLADNALEFASRAPLAGDASSRRYERVTDQAGRAFILMDDPTNDISAIQAFVIIATHLCDHGLSAPKLLARNDAQGLILMEDLGDAVFARKVAQDPGCEEVIYAAAVDLLSPIQAAPPPPDIPHFSAEKMAHACDLAFLWYQGEVQTELSQNARKAITQIHALLAEIDAPPALALRDYHAENLIWLGDRVGHAKVGLLDFQDAVLTHPLYDFVSLTRDARRDVSRALCNSLLDRYASNSGQNPETLRYAAALVGVQRNLRILGVFSRLSRQMEKPHYIDLIPRVWRMINEDLSHTDLTPLRNTLRALLPEPTPVFLEQLRTPCPTQR